MTEKSTAGAEAQLNILDRTAGISENTNTTPSSTKILIPMAIIIRSGTCWLLYKIAIMTAHIKWYTLVGEKRLLSLVL